MTERKVLNKYFPPDYDPSKIPRLPRGKRNRVFNLRTMAPFNMRCTTCKSYIYKARKFNSRMEPVDNEDYLGLRIYRFYIRCSSCCSEISWKTDIDKNDYVIESGAIRTFEATRTAYKMAIAKDAEEAEEEKKNPMRLLENRTKQSKNEMDALETLEDLKDQNLRHANLEVADRALDAMCARSSAKERNEEAEIAAEAERLLSQRTLSKDAALTSWKMAARLPRKRKIASLEGIKVKRRNEKSEAGKSTEHKDGPEVKDEVGVEVKLKVELKSEGEASLEVEKDEACMNPKLETSSNSSSQDTDLATTSEGPTSLFGLVRYSDSDSGSE